MRTPPIQSVTLGIFRCVFLFAAAFITHPSKAQTAAEVHDTSNIEKSGEIAITEHESLEKQKEQHRLQKKQYDNMKDNTKDIEKKDWQDTEATSKIDENMKDIDRLMKQVTSIDEALRKFGDTETYQKQPCFKAGSCTPEDIEKVYKENQEINGGVKSAADNDLRALKENHASLEADAKNLKELQNNADGAKGRKAALDAANQMASAQANQLLKLRALLIAQYTLEAARTNQLNALQAQRDAATKVATEGKYKLDIPKY